MFSITQSPSLLICVVVATAAVSVIIIVNVVAIAPAVVSPVTIVGVGAATAEDSVVATFTYCFAFASRSQMFRIAIRHQLIKSSQFVPGGNIPLQFGLPKAVTKPIIFLQVATISFALLGFSCCLQDSSWI
jgi:hypothetical protein